MAVSENRDVMWDRSVKLDNWLYGPVGIAKGLDRLAAEKGEDSKEYKLLKAKFVTYKMELDILNEKLTKQFEEKKTSQG